MAKNTGSKKTAASKGVAVKKSTAEFVSFTFGATIPTQAFGNVSPQIEVRAKTYEDARDFAIPRIMELYEKFAEVKPTFLGKIEVIEKDVAVDKAPEAAAPAKEEAPAMQAPVEKPKSEAVQKAEKAISLAMTEDATHAIQAQIEKSVKIDAADKPALYELVLKKRKEIGNSL